MFLLQDRANSRRLYYYINDFDSIIELPEDSDYLCELIYRGERIPDKEIEYLQRLGFEQNAQFINYSIKIQHLIQCEVVVK